MPISSFAPGTTKVISVTITLNGSNPDITLDAVTLTIKQKPEDTDPGVLQEDADVVTSGASGVAIFTLTPVLTAISVGQYPYDIVWKLPSGAEYILDTGILTITDRVSD